MDPEQIPLRDLHLPAPIGWWPPAPGWWLLAATLVFASAWFAWHRWRAWRRNAPRRLALAELARLDSAWQADHDTVALGACLSLLLRRTMLAYTPRAEVAGLTGGEWLAWLDRGLDDRPFSSGPGRCLAALPYRRRDATEVDVQALIEVVRRRLATPFRGAA